jgi:ribonuclease PH
MRHDGRQAHELRPLRIERHFTRSAPGSVLVQAGRTTVLCTASVAAQLPPWMAGRQRGWITAEYAMLPGSTDPRKERERGAKLDGRTTEIQRLVGRSLRAVADLDALGQRTITLDCDVLEADGGTRTLSITGALVALVDALRAVLPPDAKLPLRDTVAAVSVGIREGQPILDLDYAEDSTAEVDMNVVMTGSGRYVEVQGTAEGMAFSRGELDHLLTLAEAGIAELGEAQRRVLAEPPAPRSPD